MKAVYEDDFLFHNMIQQIHFGYDKHQEYNYYLKNLLNSVYYFYLCKIMKIY